MIRLGSHLLPRAGLIAALVLAGCSAKKDTDREIGPRPALKPEAPAQPPGPTQAELRQARAERNREANDVAASRPASQTSMSQRAHYTQVEQRLINSGRLRRERVPLDAPIDTETLVRNFIRVALHNEYSHIDRSRSVSGNAAPLRRWQEPVRVQVSFGPSADTALERDFRGEVASFASRLTRATGGHPVSLTAGGGNFNILFLTEDERRDIRSYLEPLVPGMPASDIAALRDLSPGIYCTVFAYSKNGNASYSHAVAVIRAELPTLLQLSCIHEEMAQGMGLANDHPEARPSIFNDNEEFALLTRHDELLLKILYDSRLRPGMSEAEATPIIREIAEDLMSDEI